MGAIFCCSQPQGDYEVSDSRSETGRSLDRAILNLKLTVDMYIAIQKHSESLKNLEIKINELNNLNEPNKTVCSALDTANVRSYHTNNI
jgi:hypothetical protein